MDDLIHKMEHALRCAQTYHEKLQNMQLTEAALRIEVKALQYKVDEFTQSKIEDRERICTLEHHINELKEENAAFSKVSQIIAMEKENARLRNEIASLQKKLCKEPEPEEQEESFVAKKIKGKLYYIAESDNSIYEYLEDGEIGKVVGRLVTKGTKLVPEFNSKQEINS